MKWTPGGRSADLEDRRGESPGYSRAGFGGMGMGRVAPIGLGGLAILFVISLLTGQDFLGMLSGGGGSVDPGPGASAPAPVGPASSTPEEEKLVDFVSFVLDDAQDTWYATPARSLSAREARALPRRRRFGVRLRASPRPGRSTVPAIRRCTSISGSTKSCAAASARPAISRRRTCSRTRSAITCRTSSAPSAQVRQLPARPA